MNPGGRGGRARSVGVLGGGTAGYLTALALHRHLPATHVEVIAARDIPPIGVGESTLPHIVPFLYDYLGLDAGAFNRAVRPTWKLGIRFEWGLPGDYWFNFPFERIEHGGAHAEGFDVRGASLLGVLMDADKSLFLPARDSLTSLVPLDERSYAFHLENRRFIAFLRDEVRRVGIPHIDARIDDVERDGEGAVARLGSDDGRSFSYDLYVDCSGFRSILLGDALGVPFVDYRSSLFTDHAIVASVPHGGRMRPYTTARTMRNGWMWRIPLREHDNVGYVFSGAHCSVDEAAAEVEEELGVVPESRALRFPAGRRARSWEGNVVAVGNAAGFVEPLESTAIHMVVKAVQGLVQALENGGDPASRRRAYNEAMARRWDFLRGFLAMHFRFNRRLDTPFWRDCREADLGEVEPLVAYFRRHGLLSLADAETRKGFTALWEAGLFGTNGIDVLLLGQGQRPPEGSVPRRGPATRWARRKRALWARLARQALPQAEALPVLDRQPELLR